jgi:hypothetical protein
MYINEPWVVYLFSKFHEQLGFTKIVDIQSSFPDCTALKDNKEVTIEFESKSGHLQTHLIYGGWNSYEFCDNRYLLKEDGENYRLYSRYRTYKNKDPDYTLSKENYFILVHPKGHWCGVRLKKLDLDYCIAWAVSDIDRKRDEYSKVSFIELNSIPVIRNFTIKRGYDF